MTYNKIKQFDNKYYFKTYSRQPLALVKGQRTKLYDTNGKEYTDFFAGVAVNCLGYNDAEISKTIAKQAKKLLHVSNHFYTEEQAKVLQLLLDGSDFTRAFLCNSGAEANECALKLIRKYYYEKGVDKPVIITAESSFHGRTLATATLTGQPKYSLPFAPLPPAIKYVKYNDIAALSEALTPDVGAVLLETVQGEGGVNPATFEYLTAAYALAKSKGVIFALDEVQTGVGRTGKMYSYEHFGIIPDVITLAKGLGGGVPIGAVLARGALAEAFKPGDHGSTFGGNPLACAAAAVVLKRLKNTPLINEVEQKGVYLNDKLTELRVLDCVADVRGIGLLVGLQLKGYVKGAEIVGKMLDLGYIINCCSNNTLRFAPPFIITLQEIDAMADALKGLLSQF